MKRTLCSYRIIQVTDAIAPKVLINFNSAVDVWPSAKNVKENCNCSYINKCLFLWWFYNSIKWSFKKKIKDRNRCYTLQEECSGMFWDFSRVKENNPRQSFPIPPCISKTRTLKVTWQQFKWICYIKFKELLLVLLHLIFFPQKAVRIAFKLFFQSLITEKLFHLSEHYYAII